MYNVIINKLKNMISIIILIIENRKMNRYSVPTRPVFASGQLDFAK